jgi:mannose/fructose/N-acetylgalactosamine-specific phosphotransferase system component IID
MRLLSDGAAIVGMMVLGGLMPTVVRFSLSASIRVGSVVISLQQDMFDAILRGLLPLALTLFVWWLLHRRMRSILVVVLLFVIGIDLAYLGIVGESVPPIFSLPWVEYVLGGLPTSVAGAGAHLAPPLLVTLAAVLVFAFRRMGQERKSKDKSIT